MHIEVSKINLKSIVGFFTSIGTLPGIISVIIVIAACIFLFKRSKANGKGLSTRDVVAIGIGAALYGVLSIFSIPVGPNTSFRLALALIPIFGSIFGPVVGFLAGFIGNALNDALTSGQVWWSWAFLSGGIGLIVGFITFDKKFDVLLGKIDKKHIVQLYVYLVLGIIIGGVFAFIGDVAFYGEPVGKEWLQIILAAISDFAVGGVIGIPVIIAISKMRAKNNNLEIEE